ncbi:MAG TPA: hypothetical protein VF092_09565 [Longimicrobium sp.]
MGVFGGVGNKIAELAQEVISNNAKFESLERTTTITLGDFKTLLQRFEDRLHAMEIRHVQEVAGLAAQIKVLEGRLHSLSEQAFHAVAEKTIRDIAKDTDGRAPTVTPEVIRLPVGNEAVDPR